MGATNVRRRGMGSSEPRTRAARGLSAFGFHGHGLSEGLPVPREQAYDATRRQDAESPAASE
jgi:hypothetical protein